MSQGTLGKIQKLRCKSLDVCRHLDCFTSFGFPGPNSISHRLDRGQCSLMQALAVAERGSEAGIQPALELECDLSALGKDRAILHYHIKSYHDYL
ncbi:hypothetical protein QUB63_08330 [Microcoleus sp. ARI1-B5]|uniref:hypothetical protein n=1 Tax=unclassified Microcoleus TaxID=2642155 RepID=UPI002FCFC953